MSMSHYVKYFGGELTGRGVNNIGPVHQSFRFKQRGRGLSSVFQGIFRFLSPYILSSTKAIGNEALRSGADLLQNLGKKPIKELIRDQRDISLKNLVDKAENKMREMTKQTGGAIKRRANVTSLIHRLNALDAGGKRKRKRKVKPKSKRKIIKKVSKTRKKTKAKFLKHYLAKK